MTPTLFLSALADSPILELDLLTAIKIACIIGLAVFAVGAVIRAIFGRGSSLTRSVSATLNILLIYLSAIVLYYYFPALRSMLNTLPFITITPEHFFVWDISGISDSVFYPALLQMAVLAFFVNTLEAYLPRGKKILTWYLYRMVTGLGAFALYSGFGYLVTAIAPEIYGSWAKTIILGFWGLIILIALLKLILSAILTVVNPILGACYAFFFSSNMGKQFSKAILTTVFMVLIVYYLNQTAFTSVEFSSLSLAAYGPTSIIILIALYLFGRFL